MPTDNGKGRLEGAALYLAVLVVLCWLGMLSWLAWQTFSATESQWSRLLSLLSSLEAVTFAAAGALFGVRIQQQRVNDSKDRADKAEKEAGEQRNIATKGKALAAAVKAEAQARRSPSEHERMSSGMASGQPRQEGTALQMANELFPD
jgi:hypothetical protein